MKTNNIDYSDKSNYRHLMKEGKVKIQVKEFKPYTTTQKQIMLDGQSVVREVRFVDMANEKNGLKKEYNDLEEAKKDLQELINKVKQM